jgi:hypothetical protein
MANTDGVEKVPQNTLMGLPNELITKLIEYAVTSDEPINLGPGTLDQDFRRVREKILAPFKEIPFLFSIAENQLTPEDLLYRTTTEGLRFMPLTDLPAGANMEKDLYFETEEEVEWIGVGTPWLKYLELAVPMEVISGDANPAVAVAKVGGVWSLLLHCLSKAFPDLRTLTIRVTTYDVGARVAEFRESSQQKHLAIERPDLIALQFNYRLAKLVEAVAQHSTPKLKIKTVIWTRADARDWRTWRYGPVFEPEAELGRREFETLGVDGVVAQMARLRCSCLQL